MPVELTNMEQSGVKYIESSGLQECGVRSILNKVEFRGNIWQYQS